MSFEKPGSFTSSASGVAIGEPLASLSINELETRVATLLSEIERVKAEIAKKKAHEAAAAAIFKS